VLSLEADESTGAVPARPRTSLARTASPMEGVHRRVPLI
jgi:hypothetical protein